MSDVAGRWLCSLLGMLGGNSGWDISYSGVAGIVTPIWDVLAPEGEQEEALNRSRTGSISPGFQIRQAVPLGLARARFHCWARWAGFFSEKNSIFIYIQALFMAPARQEWMLVDGSYSYLILDNSNSFTSQVDYIIIPKKPSLSSCLRTYM